MQGSVLLSQVVCPSIGLFIRRDWNSLKMVSRLVSLGCSYSADPWSEHHVVAL